MVWFMTCCCLSLIASFLSASPWCHSQGHFITALLLCCGFCKLMTSEGWGGQMHEDTHTLLVHVIFDLYVQEFNVLYMLLYVFWEISSLNLSITWTGKHLCSFITLFPAFTWVYFTRLLFAFYIHHLLRKYPPAPCRHPAPIVFFENWNMITVVLWMVWCSYITQSYLQQLLAN